MRFCTLTSKSERIETFEAILPELLSLRFDSLPGLESQLKMAPLNREKEIRSLGVGKNPVLSSVLLLCYPLRNGKPGILLIQRQEYAGHHSGQISFPGGRVENIDQSPDKAALRETFEETGVDPADIELMGMITPLYIPPSNHMVNPYVGISRKHPCFKADPEEVASILEIELCCFFDPANLHTKPIKLSNGGIVHTPCYIIDGNVVWGATAMILAEFIELLRKGNS
ncbi:MAG TPA: CoA pyrophosphatase [Bacteroidales bacterium]|nr:CoA pyrophosphatase [Bacteroidales bacterium]